MRRPTLTDHHDQLAHSRLSRDCWLARAREARAGDGKWGLRTYAECVAGARIWHRQVLAALRAVAKAEACMLKFDEAQDGGPSNHDQIVSWSLCEDVIRLHGAPVRLDAEARS